MAFITVNRGKRFKFSRIRNSGKMHIFVMMFVILFLSTILMVGQTQPVIPISVKDMGVAELKKGDVAMIFYVTVSNTGHEPVRLSVNSTRCCQLISKDDEDCESMKIFGGDMGPLFPQDSRNLTLLYVNLYPHNRQGSCEVLIADDKGRSIAQHIPFNTTLVTGKIAHVPRLLESYYDPETLQICDSIDHDPLNDCRPYICDIRYDGVRSLYNYATKRCEKIPDCSANPSVNNDLVAYDVETGTCKRLIMSMTAQDFAGFKEGKPSVHTLSHEHGYPINVRCHNGKSSKKGHWCECNEGWSSAPFDHKYFNPDIQVYHMCTVWKGKINAEEARNITALPKSPYKRLNILIFAFLGAAFLILISIMLYLIHKMVLARRVARLDAINKSESAPLIKGPDESD